MCFQVLGLFHRRVKEMKFARRARGFGFFFFLFIFPFFFFQQKGEVFHCRDSILLTTFSNVMTITKHQFLVTSKLEGGIKFPFNIFFLAPSGICMSLHDD